MMLIISHKSKKYNIIVSSGIQMAGELSFEFGDGTKNIHFMKISTRTVFKI